MKKTRSGPSMRLVWHRIANRFSTTKSVALISIIMSLFLVTFLLLSVGWVKSSDGKLTRAQLQGLLEDVRGNDMRMVRWDATDHTARRQVEGGCDSLPVALDMIGDTDSDGDNQEELAALTCEYATFCITDNPAHRAKLTAGHYRSIVARVASKNQQTSAVASHLIYIATFANAQNHRGFFQAGAVAQLASIIQQQPSSSQQYSAVQVMWAAAALQNMAASYCDTEDDGRCYWYWPHRKDAAAITRDSLPVTSDGTSVRQEIYQNPSLIERLVELACGGPVRGKMSTDNPFPGENAQIGGMHDQSQNLLAWAAAGALKNIALWPAARARIEPGLSCFCRLAQSPDWLEENKGHGVIEHLRRDDPCWFDRRGKLCVDKSFYDDEDYTCTDYGEATEEECTTKDRYGVSASLACCGCGGGDREDPNKRQDEL